VVAAIKRWASSTMEKRKRIETAEILGPDNQVVSAVKRGKE
jgi:hypothetical protein